MDVCLARQFYAPAYVSFAGAAVSFLDDAGVWAPESSLLFGTTTRIGYQSSRCSKTKVDGALLPP
jgi:hypothetical protein